MTRTITRFLFVAALATSAAACGDGSGSSTGGGGQGGDTGGTTTSSTTGGTGGTTMSTGGSTGGGGTGGAVGGTGGATGGTGGAVGGTGGAVGGTGGATGGTGGATGGTGGATGGAGGSVAQGGSDQIAAVRASADGSLNDLPVKGVFVTYTKPLLGQDVAGFFVQGEQAGPAIFVAIDPTTLNPEVKIGDEIDFTATGLATVGGVKEITSITGPMIVSSNNPIDPLVTDVSAAADLVTNLDMYESRVIRMTGGLTANFINAGNPQVATPIMTAGLTDPNLRVRMPEAIRATYDLKGGCTITMDYGVMWRFLSGMTPIAQPSVYRASDLKGMTCAAPTVVSAVPLSQTEVVVNFDRLMDPATISAADFTFDNGLTATAVSVNGSAVTVTTSPDQPGIMYTVTVMNVNDVLGAAIGMPNSAMFQAYVPVAQLLINEINPNIGASHDLLELLVTAPGSTNGITIHQVGSANELLVTLPELNPAMGDLIVVHLTPAGTTGIAAMSETMSKNQFPNAMFSANYDGAWDVLGNAIGLSYANRVLEVLTPAGTYIDSVPVVRSTGAPAAAYPAVLQALQAAGNWFPADCGGVLCTYVSTPTAIDISVDYEGVGTTATGNSIQRKPGVNMKQKSDWNAPAAQTFGAANP